MLLYALRLSVIRGGAVLLARCCANRSCCGCASRGDEDAEHDGTEPLQMRVVKVALGPAGGGSRAEGGAEEEEEEPPTYRDVPQ